MLLCSWLCFSFVAFGLIFLGLFDLSQNRDCSFELRLFGLQLFEPLPQIVLLGEVGVATGDEVLFVGWCHVLDCYSATHGTRYAVPAESYNVM